MENANSYDYLEKIKIQVIENLKKTTFAPSVQMQDVPRQPLGGMTEEEEAEIDDLDEDENKDVRSTQRRWDARISRDDELDESEDEEDSRMNGVRAQPGIKKRRNIMDYQNPNAVPDVEVENGVATPDPMDEGEGITPATATEVNAAVIAEVMENKNLDPAKAALAEAGTSNAASRADSPRQVILDGEGDVDMAEAPVEVEEPPPTEIPTSHVRTPPISPVPAVAQHAAPAATKSPTPPAAISEPATVAADPTEVVDKMETERDAEKVTAEASTRITEQSQP
jgi:histone deacetylase 1/2